MGWGSREKHKKREEDVIKGGEKDASVIIIPDLWRGRWKIVKDFFTNYGSLTQLGLVIKYDYYFYDYDCIIKNQAHLYHILIIR